MSKLVIGLMLVLFSLPAFAEKPQLLGYGVHSCTDFRRAYYGRQKGEEKHIAEYLRYRDWLTGFLSGLSLAVGEDVLRGVDVEGVMRRNNLYCEEHTESDFFNATMKLLETLKALP